MADECGAFIWYELMTDDVDGAREFYREVVGWEIAETNSAPGGDVDYRMIERSDGGFAGGLLVLTDEMKQGGAQPGWFGYIHAPEVDSAVKRMKADGATVHIEPHDMEGVGRIAFLTDPQGVPIYLMNPAPPADDPDARSDVFSVDQPQRMRWNEMWSADPEASIALYGELFGWQQEGEMDMGPMGKYRFLHANGTGFGAIAKAQPDGPGPRWNYYIGVDDIDRANATVTANGGEVLDGPHEIPGGEFSLHARDPQGAFIGLVGPRR